MDVIIYHNPNCSTSRNVLGLIRNAGIEPHIVEYLKSPPSRAMLEQLLSRMDLPARALLRENGTPYSELKLSDPALSEADLISAMLNHPVLINRPIVVSPLGVRLCRPSATVLEILPAQLGPFTKENGERIVNDSGTPIAWA